MLRSFSLAALGKNVSPPETEKYFQEDTKVTRDGLTTFPQGFYQSSEYDRRCEAVPWTWAKISSKINTRVDLPGLLVLLIGAFILLDEVGRRLWYHGVHSRKHV